MVDFYVPSSLKCGAHLSCSDLSRKSMGKEKVTLNNTTPIKSVEKEKMWTAV